MNIKRALSRLALAAALAIGALMPMALPVFATGDCGVAWVKVFSGANGTGSVRQYCYGVNDSNYSGETSTIMGPLSNGTYAPDFDSVSNTSGVSSYQFIDQAGGWDIVICFYNNVSFDGLVQFDTASGLYNMGIGVDNVTESFAFYRAPGTCP